MATKPNTFFSGTTGPTGDRPGPDRVLGRLGMYILLAIVFPWALIVYAVWLGLFTYARLPWWVPGAVGAALLVGGLPFHGVSIDAFMFYAQGYIHWVTAAMNGKDILDSLFANLGQIIGGQLWLGTLLATCWAGIVTSWKWVRRPSWQEHFIKPGPVLKQRWKKTADEIARGVNSPSGGITLGVAQDKRDPRFAGGKPGEEYGKRVVIADAELAGHTFVVGGSGAGKTQTMLSGIRDVIRQGRGVVFIDCKGGPDVPEKIAEWAHRYGRDFYHWTIQDPRMPYHGPAEGPAYYDPVSRGDASRRKDLLIGSQRWDIGVEYYKEIISNYLQTLFRVADLVPPLEGADTFTDVADLLAPEALIYRARHIDASQNLELASALERLKGMAPTELSGIRSMYARLHTLISSTAGTWLKKDPEGRRDIDLRRVADQGQVVVFSLDTSNYEATATQIAGLIIQDLKTLSSELRHDPAPAPLHVYVDEFSAVDTTNILGLLAKARDAKMPCTLATQALADLARREHTFVDQVLGIVSSFIVHRANAEADARVYAGLSGIQRKTVERMSFEASSGTLGTMGAASATGVGYSEERDEYAIPVGAFQNLKKGEAIFIAKSPALRYVNTVQVIMENEMVPDEQRDPGLDIIPVYKAYPQALDKVTYPHPTLVALGKMEDPSAQQHDAREVLDTLLDLNPQDKAKKPAGPRRPGSQPSDADLPGVVQAGAPLPSFPAPETMGRPAGAPMPPVVQPPAQPVRMNPEEWNGIP
jgi:hypothetical protein